MTITVRSVTERDAATWLGLRLALWPEYVVPEARRRGVGRALIAAADEWARAQGCTEFASDTLADNDVSTAAHQALGFEELK